MQARINSDINLQAIRNAMAFKNLGFSSHELVLTMGNKDSRVIHDRSGWAFIVRKIKNYEYTNRINITYLSIRVCNIRNIPVFTK
jgi:hypothetical protein